MVNQAKESSIKTTTALEKEAIAHAWNAKKAEKLGYADQIGREDLESQLLSDGEIVTVGYVDDDQAKDYLVVFLETGNCYQVNRSTGEISSISIIGKTIGKKPEASTYKKVGNVYANSPDLSNLDYKNTYYMTCSSDLKNLEVYGKIDKVDEPSDWYDYSKSSQKWANIITVANESVAYWVWIPRYKYKVESGTPLIEFVDINDECKDSDGNIKILSDDYQVPESFTFNGRELSGIWVSKYEVSNVLLTEISETFSTDGTMTLNTSAASSVYDVWVDGELLLDDVNFPQTISTENTVCEIMVAKNNGEIVYLRDSIQKLLPIEVDISNIQKDVSYYVLYDKTGQDPQEVLMTEDLETAIQRISAEKGKEYIWYDYGRKIWANIVTKGKDSAGKESITYWTYIPRYAYDTTNYSAQNRVEIQFISKDVKNGDNGLVVPESFTFAGKELPGIWVSKYEVSAAP